MRQADAILCADIHLREDTPEAWDDTYWEAQEETIGAIRILQEEHNCHVLAAGDIFHRPRPPIYLVSWAMRILPMNFIAIPGQHDLPEHSMDLYTRSGLYALEVSQTAEVLEGGKQALSAPCDVDVYGYEYGQELIGKRRPSSNRRIAMCHVMAWTKKVPYPGCKDDPAEKLLERMYGFDLVLTGDNHQPFVIKKDGRLLVNPGSTMQSTAAQMKHRPRVYL